MASTLDQATRRSEPPDWDLVYKRNSIERLKRDRSPIGVRGELGEMSEVGYEAVSEEDIVRLNWLGLTHDKPKIGTFMVRIKVPGGLIRAEQLRAVGAIARRYGRDANELTTRQGTQLHWVRLDQLAEVLDQIDAAGLTTVGCEGDTVRNITGCPVAGLDSGELFDVRPVIEEAARFFYGNPDYSNLPRKHKYTVAACPSQCNLPEIHDVALIAVLKDGRQGFALRVGGGMSNTPRISRDVGVFVPFDEAVSVLRAVTDVWQSDLRYRVSRAKARIKFMMDDYGPEGVRARVEERLGHALEDGTAPEPTGSADHLGVHPQRQDGLVYVGVPVPVGRVSGTQMEQLADLMDEFGADLRFTRQQNFILGNVPQERLEDVGARLAEIGFPMDRGGGYGRSIACTSHEFCNYSVAETKGKLLEVLGHLEGRFGAEPAAGLTIHMDGCPHSCAQHWIGEIGLQGTTAPGPEGTGRIEAYDVMVGGGIGARAQVGRQLLRRVPSEELEGVMERLVGAWLSERSSTDVTFGQFVDTRTDEDLSAWARGENGALAATAARPAQNGRRRASGTGEGVAVHIPGPLLPLVDGADLIEVPAGTVGEVLAAVGRAHPKFAEAVIPGGEISETYLVFLNEDDVQALEGLRTPAAAGSRIAILVAMSGG
jgi:sulfite reductase beta subunit-like hemoprotein